MSVHQEDRSSHRINIFAAWDSDVFKEQDISKTVGGLGFYSSISGVSALVVSFSLPEGACLVRLGTVIPLHV